MAFYGYFFGSKDDIVQYSVKSSLEAHKKLRGTDELLYFFKETTMKRRFWIRTCLMFLTAMAILQAPQIVFADCANDDRLCFFLSGFGCRTSGTVTPAGG